MEVGSKSKKGKAVLEENNEFKETRAGVRVVSLPGRLQCAFLKSKACIVSLCGRDAVAVLKLCDKLASMFQYCITLC